jgi:hypothetical protein
LGFQLFYFNQTSTQSIPTRIQRFDQLNVFDCTTELRIGSQASIPLALPQGFDGHSGSGFQNVQTSLRFGVQLIGSVSTQQWNIAVLVVWTTVRQTTQKLQKPYRFSAPISHLLIGIYMFANV